MIWANNIFLLYLSSCCVTSGHQSNGRPNAHAGVGAIILLPHNIYDQSGTDDAQSGTVVFQLHTRQPPNQLHCKTGSTRYLGTRQSARPQTEREHMCRMRLHDQIQKKFTLACQPEHNQIMNTGTAVCHTRHHDSILTNSTLACPHNPN